MRVAASTLAFPLLLALGLGGCATKRDLRDLRTEVRSSQEETLREIRQQNDAILDSLGVALTRLRGDMTNQLVEMERQLVQIQELTGQGQQRLADLREQIRNRQQTIGMTGDVGAPPAAGNPEELFNLSLAALRRGSLTTARAGFEEFLRAFPQHPLAPDAQFHIGESYEEGDDPAPALEAYGRVLELYPNASRAPTALYRAGMIEVERGNEEQARTLLERVVSAFPESPEAPLAREQLDQLGGG